ncbi:MAG TPA: Zn-ribbon domain-containing OB-fold protein [Acidimicrobiales bacterium]|nr:Zn-ribbon domain-containing OB-fold protein [Acidimicrobiales bacterium]
MTTTEGRTEERRPTRMEPPVTPTTEPFWDATRRGELVLQWCRNCQVPVFYPREVCPGCLGDGLEWRPATGKGRIYTFTVEHRPNPVLGDRYVVALVDLEEGARVMSNVVNCPPDKVEVGMAVRVTWEELSDGRRLPLFEPDQEA